MIEVSDIKLYDLKEVCNERSLQEIQCKHTDRSPLDKVGKAERKEDRQELLLHR